jgi:DNA adenine methylase
MLFDRLTSRLALVELDEQIAAVWRSMLSDGSKLASRVLAFDLTKENVMAELSIEPLTVLDRAFQTIIRNRVQRGGIMASGAGLLKEGGNGHGIASRWYPETLSRRILDIAAKHQSITFEQGDGIAFITRHSHNADMIWFIDPPYTVAGRRLYTHSEIDHRKLFQAVSNVKGDFLMTYDNTKAIRTLANEFGFQTHKIRMKNTHHTLMYELLVGRNLEWARQPLQLVKNPLYEDFKTCGDAGG